MTASIYLITCTTNGATYVGSCRSTTKRWSRHRRDLAKNQHPNAHLQAIWNKFGADTFKFEIIEEVEERFVLAVEQSYLDYYTRRPGNVNMARSATAPTLGMRFSPETRAKMSAAHRGRPAHNKGTRYTPEIRARMAASHVGSKRSEATRQRMSVAQLARYAREKQ